MVNIPSVNLLGSRNIGLDDPARAIDLLQLFASERQLDHCLDAIPSDAAGHAAVNAGLTVFAASSAETGSTRFSSRSILKVSHDIDCGDILETLVS